MMVLPVLHPTVILSRFVGPQLNRIGAEPWLVLWISQVSFVGAAVVVVCCALRFTVFATVKWLQLWYFAH